MEPIENVQEVIQDLPMINLSELSLAGMRAETITAVAAAVFLIAMMARGYRRGVLVELSGLIALAASFVVMLFCSSYVIRIFPIAWGRAPRAVVYALICFLTFRLVRSVVKKIGSIFRGIPVVGWLVGALGAVAGCLEAVMLIMMFQIVSGVNVTGAVQQTLDQLPFSL